MLRFTVRAAMRLVPLAALSTTGCLWEANAPPVVVRPAVQSGPVVSEQQPGPTPGGNPGDSTAAANVDLKILDYDGIQKLIQSHKGKVVVVDCWSTY